MSDTAEQTVETPVPQAPSGPNAASRFLARLAGWLSSRRFGRIVTPFIVICVVTLLGLGTWQLQRLHWKNTVLTQASDNFKTDAIDLRKALPKDTASWQGLHYKSIIIDGHWLTPFHAIKMGPRTHEGDAGYQLLIPLQLKDGQIVLINRGFAPDKMGILPPVKMEVTIHGVAYLPETVKPPFMPENIPSRSVWVWPDMVALGHEVGRDNIAPVMIFENRLDKSDEFPLGGQLPLPGNNSHRQYAVTWYALAFALIVIWLMVSNPKAEVPESTLSAGKDKEVTDPVAKRGMYPEPTD